jgi:hypothetical protein
MRAKISEKKLLVGLACFVMGIILLLNTSLVPMPILVSEKSILYIAIAAALVAFGIFSFKRSIRKV